MTDWQFHFFGWKPTPGEFIVTIIWPIVVLLIGALLVEPFRRWLSRTWNFFIDRISSLSAGRKAKRIKALELKITHLKEYDDRKVMAHFLRGISGLILLVVLTTAVGMFVTQYNILISILQITDFFKITNWSILGITQGLPGFSILAATEIQYLGFVILLSMLAVFTFSFVAALFQEMTDFADPPKAIQRLEERINAMRAKST